MSRWSSSSKEKVRKFYIEERSVEPEDEGNVSINVTFDGTWMTRGHKSHFGLCFVIDAYTGIVDDMEVMSNY